MRIPLKTESTTLQKHKKGFSEEVFGRPNGKGWGQEGRDKGRNQMDRSGANQQN